MYLGFSQPAAKFNCQSSSLLPSFKLILSLCLSKMPFVTISYFLCQNIMRAELDLIAEYEAYAMKFS